MEITIEERALVGKTKMEDGVEWKLGLRRVKGEERLVWTFGRMVRVVTKQEIDILLGGGVSPDGPSAPQRTTRVEAKDLSKPQTPAEPDTNLLAALIKVKGNEQEAKDTIQKAKLGKLNISVDGRTLAKSTIREETPLGARAKVRAFAIVSGG